MSRRGENIRKRKDGRWEGRYIEKYDTNGKACYRSVYSLSYTDLKNKLKEYKSGKSKKINYNISIENLCNEWLLSKELIVKQSTYTHYYTLINKHIIPYFKNKNVKCLINESFDLFVADKGICLSGKTVHDIIAVLKQIIRYAQTKQYIEYFDFNVNQPKIKNNDLPVLNNYEYSKLISYIQLTLENNKIGILLSLFMGIRLGEICALKWEDVNFKTGMLRINKTMQRIKNLDINSENKTKIVIDKPKSQKSIRNIPIPSFILNLLKEYQSDENNYLLSGTRNYIEPRAYQKMFKRYLKQAGIENINFHALRHTFATRAIEKDFDVKSLSEILGHSSVKFTLEKYVHPSYEHKKMNMEKLSAFY